MNPTMRRPSISARPRPLALPAGAGRGEGARRHLPPTRPLPRGLTLVELLVSIAIVATLAALLVPTIANAMRAARSAAMKAEIDMLNTAMLNYRSEYGELPPCIDTRYGAGTIGYKAAGEAARHLQRLFPRCVDPAAQLNALGERLPDPTSDNLWIEKLRERLPSQSMPARFGLAPNTALTAWLAGFTPDPRNPLDPPAARVKLFDFDTSRRNRIGEYAPAKKPKSPFIYIDSANYELLPYVPGSDQPGAHIRENNEFFNADTFQILCAGLDEQFGTDDDLSNFWPGTRKEYLDSLK